MSVDISPTFEDVLAAAASHHVRQINTASWGTIQSFDSATKRATVQLVPREARTDETGERIPERVAILHNVPVLFPGTGSNAITWVPSDGSFVVVLFMQSSMDKFLVDPSDDVDPGDDRRHSLNDAVALPVQLTGGGDSNPAAMVITAGAGGRVDIGSASLNPAQDGVLTGQSIDIFTGTQHFALGNASPFVLARKLP